MLASQAGYIQCSIMISIQDHTTMCTDVGAHTQIFVWSLLQTCAAYLARVLGVDLQHTDHTSILSFVGTHEDEG